LYEWETRDDKPRVHPFFSSRRDDRDQRIGKRKMSIRLKKAKRMSASSTRSQSPPGAGGQGSEVSNFTSASQIVRNVTNVLSAINTALPTPTTPHDQPHDQPQWPNSPVQTIIDNDQLQFQKLALSLNQIQLGAESPPPVIPGRYLETETGGPQSQSATRPRSLSTPSSSTDAVYPEGYAGPSTPSTARPPSVARIHRVYTQPEEHGVLSPSTFRSESGSTRSYGPYLHRQLEDQIEPTQLPLTIRPPGPASIRSPQSPYHHQEIYHHIEPGFPSSPHSPPFPHSPYHQKGHSPTEGQPLQRTIEDVRLQVARSIAARAITKAELVDGSKVGVVFTLNKSQDDRFLRTVAGEIRALLNTGYTPPPTATSLGSQGQAGYLFALTAPSSPPSSSNRGTTRSGHSQSHYSYSVPSQSFITGSGSRRRNSPPTKLVIVGSSPVFVHRAILLTRSKFLGRTVENITHDDRVQGPGYPHPTATIIPGHTGVIPTMSATPRSVSIPILEPTTITPEQDLLWEVGVYGLGGSSYDELALRDVVKKSVANLMEPLVPPPGSMSVTQLLSHTRAKLERMTPDEAFGEVTNADEMAPPIFLIDIRSEGQRREFGDIQGSIVIDRNDLEWKLDPRSRGRLGPSAIVDRFDVRVILLSHDGNASSLAARSLHLIGLRSATDVIGGFLAWRAAGLPITLFAPGGGHPYEDTLSSATERGHGSPVVER
jgi:rhodanese-related sulfurtransferase